MGTGHRLTAEGAQAESNTPGFLPALEAGQALTFGIPRTTRFLMPGSGVLLFAPAGRIGVGELDPYFFSGTSRA